MSEDIINQVKELTVNWRDGKCFHCGAQMQIKEIGDDTPVLGCPKCDWVDDQVNNWNYLNGIGVKLGIIFHMTGTAYDKYRRT